MARKQEELARKDQELRMLDSDISAKLEQMQMLENRLSAMIKDAENTRDAKFRHLVDVLSNMKARQAAAVLETLDQKIAVNVLAGMRGRQAGEILSFVRPEVAAHLAEALARMQLPFE
jgi:flagellar motility protein MotE (MotC chaperone)